MSNKVTIELYVDDKGTVHVKKFAGETEKGFKKIETQAKKTGGTLKNLATAAVGFFAITKIKSAITDFVRLAGIQEDAVKTLEQAMRNAGTYRKEDLEGLKAYASQRQEVTRIGDEATLATLANLQGYQMEVATLKEATKAAQDLAAAKKMDLFAASELIGKAFVGETQTLSRYGIILDEGIPKGEKFAAVLKLISERYGGQAEALASTKYGGLVQLGNLLGDAKEDIGGLVMAITENLLPAFKSWAGHLRDIAKFWKEALTPPDDTERLLTDRIIFTQELELAQGRLVRLQGRLNTMQEAGSDYHVKRITEEIEKTKQVIATRAANLRLINQTLIAEKKRKEATGGEPGTAGPAAIETGDYYKEKMEEWKQVTADFYAMKGAQEKADLAQHKATLDEWGKVTQDFCEAERAQWGQETEAYLALEEIKAQAHQEELARYQELMEANEQYMKQYEANEKAKAELAYQTTLSMVSWYATAFQELAKGSKLAFAASKIFSAMQTLMKTHEFAVKAAAWAATWGGLPAAMAAKAAAYALGMAHVIAIQKMEPAAYYHQGGIVGRGSRPSRLVSADVFAGAQRAHEGLAPDERPVIVRKDEGIFTPEQMAALGLGANMERRIDNHVHVYLDGRDITKAGIRTWKKNGVLKRQAQQALL